MFQNGYLRYACQLLTQPAFIVAHRDLDGGNKPGSMARVPAHRQSQEVCPGGQHIARWRVRIQVQEACAHEFNQHLARCMLADLLGWTVAATHFRFAVQRFGGGGCRKMKQFRHGLLPLAGKADSSSFACAADPPMQIAIRDFCLACLLVLFVWFASSVVLSTFRCQRTAANRNEQQRIADNGNEFAFKGFVLKCQPSDGGLRSQQSSVGGTFVVKWRLVFMGKFPVPPHTTTTATATATTMCVCCIACSCAR